MKHLSKKLDQYLLDLAWSLWSELGVAGVIRNHQNYLITLEELILLTAVLAEIDPRLRDESLDWCSQYHHFFSVSRLRALIKLFDNTIEKSFLSYACTLNSISSARWPFTQDSPPQQVRLSHKSSLRPLESPALLNIRVRSIFGAGARADLMTYFLTHPELGCSAADLIDLGYSKRNIAETLDGFCLSKIFDKFMVRNQYQYRLAKNINLINALSPIPKYAPSWHLFFKVLFSLRNCVKRIETSSESTKVIEIRNTLLSLKKNIQLLNLTPPPFQSDFSMYLESFSKWLLEIAEKLAKP